MISSVQTVALAAILLAAAKLGLPLPNDQPNLFIFDEFFKLHQRRNPEADFQNYNSLSWILKIDERINEGDLFECLK